MSFFPKPPLIVAIETTPSSFKIAKLKKKGKTWEIVSLDEVSHDVNPLDNVPKDAFVVSALPSREVLVRPLDLPLKKEKDIESAYAFQAEPLLPYPAEKGVIQKIIVKGHAEGTLLTILSAKKDHLERHLQFLKERSCAPHALTAEPLALSSIAALLPKTLEPQLMMAIGEKEGTVAFVENGKLLTARAFEREKSEIQKSVLAILSNYKSRKIDTILVVEGNKEDIAMIEEATGKTVVIPKVLELGEERMQKFGVVVGLALAATEKKFPNFLEKGFSLEWKRVQKPLLTYFSVALLLFISATAFERVLIEKQEQMLLTRSSALFAMRPPTISELEEKLGAHEKEIAKLPDTFPLLPQVPKVKDILAVLSTDESQIEIEEFRYAMVLRPDFDRKHEKYQVKVELTFTATSPASAHAFHEALLTKNPLVDPKKEVEWIAGKGKYRASFFLKDKTRYS